jgi:hypothetical protein
MFRRDAPVVRDLLFSLATPRPVVSPIGVRDAVDADPDPVSAS